MANKVFVSPGVYTSEVDLSFVAQSVGVTTLGIVGETLKGPAFEPIFITNFDEFSTFYVFHEYLFLELQSAILLRIYLFDNAF